MLYLVTQIAIFIAVGAGLGFGLGVLFHRYFSGRANIKTLRKVFNHAKSASVEELELRIATLEQEIEDKDRAMQILMSSAPQGVEAPLTPALSLGEIEDAPTDQDTGEVPLPFQNADGSEAIRDPAAVKDERPGSFENQIVSEIDWDRGTNVVSTETQNLQVTLAQREAKIEDLQDRLAGLTAELAKFEVRLDEERAIQTSKFQSELARSLQTHSMEISALRAKLEEKDREALKVLSQLEELQDERSREHTRPDTDLEELESYWRSASSEYEREKTIWSETERALRAEVEDLRVRLRSAAADNLPPAIETDKIERRLESIERHCAELATQALAVPFSHNADNSIVERLHDIARKLDELSVRSGETEESEFDAVLAQVSNNTSDEDDVVDLWGGSRGSATVIPMDPQKIRNRPVEDKSDDGEARIHALRSLIQDRVESKLTEMTSHLERLESKLSEAQRRPEDVNPDWVRHLESLMLEQERMLEHLKAQQASPEIQLLEQRGAELQKELERKEQRILHLSSSAELSQHEQRQLRKSLEDMQALLTEKEGLIAELEGKLKQLSHKVAPELTGKDDLKLIRGIGPAVEKMLKNKFGIQTFKQIALLDSKLAEKISSELFFGGKIERDDWVGQAIALHHKKYDEVLYNADPPYPLRLAV